MEGRRQKAVICHRQEVLQNKKKKGLVLNGAETLFPVSVCHPLKRDSVASQLLQEKVQKNRNPVTNQGPQEDNLIESSIYDRQSVRQLLGMQGKNHSFDSIFWFIGMETTLRGEL